MIFMNKKGVIEKIGKERWKEFEEFMKGQTIGINEDGTEDFYSCDVENFLRPRHKQFFD